MRSADTHCKKCGGWRLDPSGVGIDRAEEELEETVPKSHIFVLDREKAKTAAQARKIVSNFNEAPWGVLLGTEAAFPYLQEKLESAAILSLDSLFALPDFRISERIMHVIFKTRALAENTFVIQTRNPDEKVLHFAKDGNSMDFYQSEIAERERFSYPPFSVLVEISLGGTRTAVEAEMAKLKDIYFKGYDLEIFPAFIPEAKGVYTMRAVLKVPRKEWPKYDLVEKLRALGSAFKVQIDPESIL